MYWNLGKRIFEEEQQGKERADYGTYLVKTLAKNLEKEYGSGFGNIDEIYGGIILTKKSMTGHVHEMHYHSICHPSTDNNIISIFNIPDPSQCILRYSFIKNNGFIPGEGDYDYKWFISNIRNYKDQFIYYNDYNGWFSDMINAYHNNLRHLEDIEKYIDDFNYKETYIDVAIQNEDTHPLNFPILKKETQEKILELIKEDLLNT